MEEHSHPRASRRFIKAWLRQQTTHEPNLNIELRTAKVWRLNQLGMLVSIFGMAQLFFPSSLARNFN